MAQEDKYANAIAQGKSQLESIREMVGDLRKTREWLEEAGNADACAMIIKTAQEAVEAAEQAIEEDPLSVEVRGGWHTPGAKEEDAEEYRLLLCTGGPACQLRGLLGTHNEPGNDIWLEVQDWFLPWKPIDLEPEDREILREYARCFYYGE